MSSWVSQPSTTSRGIILIIDDEYIAFGDIIPKLKSKGFNPLHVVTPDEAFTILEKNYHEIVLIVLDLLIPATGKYKSDHHYSTGYHIYTAIRQRRLFTSTPIIVYTHKDPIDLFPDNDPFLIIRRKHKTQSDELLSLIENKVEEGEKHNVQHSLSGKVDDLEEVEIDRFNATIVEVNGDAAILYIEGSNNKIYQAEYSATDLESKGFYLGDNFTILILQKLGSLEFTIKFDPCININKEISRVEQYRKKKEIEERLSTYDIKDD